MNYEDLADMLAAEYNVPFEEVRDLVASVIDNANKWTHPCNDDWVDEDHLDDNMIAEIENEIIPFLESEMYV